MRSARRITTASAEYVPNMSPMPRDLFKYLSWQEEAWSFWRHCGEVNNGITWLAYALSRVRLQAAEMVPGGNEPTPLREGAAAELMEQFAGGIAGHAQIMAAFGFQLGVPGEGWLVVERDDESIPIPQANWRVMPTTALRYKESKVKGGLPDITVRIGEALWRPLAEEGMATRVKRDDPEFPWRAISAVQAALPILRRIDLIDRRIVAVMVSRLATNGMLVYPQEGQFQVPDQYKEAPDPFAQMFVEIASNNIRNPGMASAAIPLLVGYAEQYIDKIKLIKWDDLLPAELLDEREKEIKRLATTLHLPTEWLTGMSDMNHWNGALVSREAVKIYLSPYTELICEGITEGYLQPMMKQLGEDMIGPEGGKIMVWYDVAELTTPPDKSQNAKDAFDRWVIGEPAFRKHLGFEESEAPDKKQLEEMGLKWQAKQPATATAALAQLTGKPAPQTPESGVLNGPEGAGQPALPAVPEATDEFGTFDDSGAEAAITASFGPPLGLRRPSPRPRVYNGTR